MLLVMIKLRDLKVSSILPKVTVIWRCNGGYFPVDDKTSGQKYSFFFLWVGGSRCTKAERREVGTTFTIICLWTLVD